MEKSLKEILFKERFRFCKEQDEYQFQLKRKHGWWPFPFWKHIKEKKIMVFDHVDIVMCIDHTSSMGSLFNMIKDKVIHFHSDFMDCCAKHHKEVREMCVRVISFGDYGDGTHRDSGLFKLPDENQLLNDFVQSLELTGGGDLPEDGLEALALAIKTSWEVKCERHRHVIVLYTDAPPHSLGRNANSSYYPSGMPKDFKELTSWWKSMDKNARRLVLFAPRSSMSNEKTEWYHVAKKWDHVILESKNLVSVLSGKGYLRILETICKSL